MVQKNSNEHTANVNVKKQKGNRKANSVSHRAAIQASVTSDTTAIGSQNRADTVQDTATDSMEECIRHRAAIQVSATPDSAVMGSEQRVDTATATVTDSRKDMAIGKLLDRINSVTKNGVFTPVRDLTALSVAGDA